MNVSVFMLLQYPNKISFIMNHSQSASSTSRSQPVQLGGELRRELRPDERVTRHEPNAACTQRNGESTRAPHSSPLDAKTTSCFLCSPLPPSSVPFFYSLFPHLPLSHPHALLDTIYHPVINVSFHLFSTHLSIHQFPVSTSVCLLVWFFFLVGLFLFIYLIALTKHILLNLLKSCEPFPHHFDGRFGVITIICHICCRLQNN